MICTWTREHTKSDTRYNKEFTGECTIYDNLLSIQIYTGFTKLTRATRLGSRILLLSLAKSCILSERRTRGSERERERERDRWDQHEETRSQTEF